MNRSIKRLLLFFCPFIFLAFWACNSAPQEEQSSEGEDKMFTLLYPTHTNINFQNKLTEGLNTNILMYEYFYNGGGVATADFNGDGLEDIYFTANMSENKLYLNNGDLHFQDITNASGAGGRPGPWKTGVSVVDINNDGRLDIYLCYSGSMPAEKRTNQLFVNQGNNKAGIPEFKEAAAEYGLASTAYSNQAYFLDADNDGDLDMLLLNHNPKNLPILNEAGTRQMLRKDDKEMGLRFFKQTNGKFADETVGSGINGSALSYGLGLGISDFNDDGLPDFYVSNDYSVPDYLYYNIGNGRFINKLESAIGHTSQFSMGNDVADYNNDGLTDIFTLDMLPEDNKRQKLLLAPDNFNKFDQNFRSGFYYQYMRNMLQQNNGNGTFSEIGQQLGVSNTDWSWSSLLADFDNDGWKDLYISNGYFKDFTNLDFIKYMDDFVAQKGRLNREDVLEIIKHMPASNVVNYMYKNNNGKGFLNMTSTWGMNEPSNSNGAAYADLDNDGDLDIVVNNINQAAFVYRNDTQSNFLKCELKGSKENLNGLGSKIEIRVNGKKQFAEQNPYRGYQSAVSNKIHFGLGKEVRVDSLIITWPDNKQQVVVNIKANETIQLDYAQASMSFKKSENFRPLFVEKNEIAFSHNARNVRDFDRQSLLINELSFEGPCLAKGDINNDGLEDFFVGGGMGKTGTLYLQDKNGTFKISNFPSTSHFEESAAKFADVNQDGFKDLYIAAGGYHDLKKDDSRLQDHLYLNDGNGNFKESVNALPEMKTATAAISFIDFDNDGDLDVFVGGRSVPGGYPEIPRSYLLVNDGKGAFTDKTLDLAPELGYIGMVTDASWADLDKNGTDELILVGEWMPITVFEKEKGKFKVNSKKYFGKEYFGWWNCLTISDLNKDGFPDILAGNMGLNTQFKASDKEPAELHASDFDQNGSIDPIFSYYIQGKTYPYLTRDELVDQLPKFKTQFNTFESYSTTTLDKILTQNDLENALYFKATEMKTSFFLSNGKGSLTEISLPAEVQYAPIYTIEVLDFDNDGHSDVFLAGNNHHTKLRFGNFDANKGILLKGDSKDFNYINQRVSGFNLHGDVRSSLYINDKLILGINGGGIKTYKVN